MQQTRFAAELSRTIFPTKKWRSERFSGIAEEHGIELVQALSF